MDPVSKHTTDKAKSILHSVASDLLDAERSIASAYKNLAGFDAFTREHAAISQAGDATFSALLAFVARLDRFQIERSAKIVALMREMDENESWLDGWTP